MNNRMLLQSAINSSIPLEVGTFLDSDGVTKDIRHERFRNMYPVPVGAFASIRLPTGYSMYVFQLDSSGILIGPMSGWRSTLDVDELATGTGLVNISIRRTATPNDDISSDLGVVQGGMVVDTALSRQVYKRYIFANAAVGHKSGSNAISVEAYGRSGCKITIEHSGSGFAYAAIKVDWNGSVDLDQLSRIRVRVCTDVRIEVLSANGPAWGSVDGKIRAITSTVLDPVSGYVDVDFDFSQAVYSSFFSDATAPKQLYILVGVGRYASVTPAAGTYTIYMYADDMSLRDDPSIIANSDTTVRALYAEYADTANVAINCAEAETSVLAKRATYAANAGVVGLVTAADATWRKYSGDADDAVTITQDGEYIHVVKPVSKYARYAGVYLRVRYDSLDDLDGDFMLEIPPGKLPSPTLLILYGLHDWGNTTVNGTIDFTMNTVYNLKELLRSVEGVSYADRNELYITVLTYRPTAGDSPEVDFRARLKFSASNAEVIATDFNASATERIKEIADGDSKYVVCWGDSLTAQGGWIGWLETLSGLPVYNCGTGGENSRCIMARQGADVMIVNNITIPATTTPVLIASRASDGGIKTQAGYTVTPLLQGDAHVNPCKIGDVEGTLTWTGSSYADTTGTWTFTRSAAGDAVTITRPTPIRTDFDRNRNAPHLMIIFMGQNGGYTDFDDLVRQHWLMIEHSRAKHMLLLGLSSGTAAQRAEYEVRMTKEFGRYFLSLRAYLATPLYAADGTTITSCYGLDDAGLTPTADDLTAIAEGRTPPQMLSDSVHYTTATKEVIGKLIYKTACELGIF